MRIYPFKDFLKPIFIVNRFHHIISSLLRNDDIIDAILIHINRGNNLTMPGSPQNITYVYLLNINIGDLLGNLRNLRRGIYIFWPDI